MATERLDDDTLADLSRRARAGDIAARNRIVEAHIPLVKKIAMASCGPGMEFQDAIQEGALGMVEAATACDPARVDRFTKFAMMRIRGCVLNARPRHAGSLLLGDDDPAASEPDEDDGGAERAMRLDAAICSLPPAGAEVIERHYGLRGRVAEETSEIAASIGIGVGALDSRMNRLRGAIRRHMERADRGGPKEDPELRRAEILLSSGKSAAEVGRAIGWHPRKAQRFARACRTAAVG